MATETNATLDNQIWYADSGANVHITSNAANLTTQHPFEGTNMITVGNGIGLSIQNNGHTSLLLDKHSFQLKNILHCPDASINLLSINKFCLDNNCYFILTGCHFFVKHNQTNKILFHGQGENGLYPLPGNKSFSNKMHCFATKLGTKTTKDGSHSRLGHPSKLVLNSLFQSGHLPCTEQFTKSTFCKSCPIGKAKQVPYNRSTQQTNGPLILIHSNVWVSPITSASGYRFYVLFVDDFSRFTRLYPMANKFDVLHVFKQYKALVENYFSCKIKQFQTDNGGEYLSNEFKLFLSTNGISHHLTCPYSSPQNGIAERKHRHIREMGLTFLAQSHLPNTYWPDSFLT